MAAPCSPPEDDRGALDTVLDVMGMHMDDKSLQMAATYVVHVWLLAGRGMGQ
jgi:hypothetical protein